ncbi:major facilitator superfamily domain-containing protein [Mycena olivaceomarginata]|nr:major facilitator superfamily domain-containing protein [Mycena olivaceomarginata]
MASSAKSSTSRFSPDAMMVATFLAALDLTAVATALPTIADSLSDTTGDYIWVGSVYARSSTAFIPLSGNLADVYGSITFFVLGNALAGIGGGGILTLSEIITADLVPLAERGLYQGMLALVWGLASFCGPPITGKSWRWLFYLNLPLGAMAFTLVFVFLSVKRPRGSTRDKLVQVDWMFAWAGIRYSWTSPHVLTPLVLGVVLLLIFGIYEDKVAVCPAVPRNVELLTTMAHGVVTIVFFQACFGASPLRSAVDFLPVSLTSVPFGFLATLSVGFTVREDASVGEWVGYQIICALGAGPLFGAPMFAPLAPLPNTRAASALALFSFTRAFAQTWAITIASTILQNIVKKNLPPAFAAQFPPESPSPPSLMAVVWQTMTGFAGLGFILSLFMLEVQMSTAVDESYALKEKEKGRSHGGANGEVL